MLADNLYTQKPPGVVWRRARRFGEGALRLAARYLGDKLSDAIDRHDTRLLEIETKLIQIDGRLQTFSTRLKDLDERVARSPRVCKPQEGANA